MLALICTVIKGSIIGRVRGSEKEFKPVPEKDV